MIKKFDIKYFGFILILLLMLIGSAAPILTFVCMILSAIIGLIIALSTAKDSNSSVAKGIITLLMFQNFCIGLGSHVFSNNSPSLKFITQIPFMTLGIIYIYLLISNKLINKTKQNKLFLIYLFTIVFASFIGRGSFQAILITVRNLTTFFFAYSIGRLSINSKSELDSFVKYLFCISSIFLFAGIILLLGGYPLYKLIGLKEVYIAKGSPIIGDRLDSRFFTTLYKTQVTRMGSLLYEPVNLAYFYSLTFVLSVFYSYSSKFECKLFNIIINFFGLFLTFGKGGYLICVALFFFLILTKFNNKFFNNYCVSIRNATFIGFFFLIIFCLYYYKNVGAAATTHFWAIEGTWNSVMHRPIGYGLGIGGNMASLFNNELNSLDSGGETALLSFMYQLGIQGVFFLCLCMLSLRTSLTEILKIKKLDSFDIILYFIPLVLIGISIMQDNTFTPQCIVPFMLLLGGSSSLYKKEKVGDI